MKYLSRLYAEHGALFWQIVRYGVTGLFVTADWKAHRNVAGTLPITVLINDVPAY